MNILSLREKKEHSIMKKQIKRRSSKHGLNSVLLDSKVICQTFEILMHRCNYFVIYHFREEESKEEAKEAEKEAKETVKEVQGILPSVNNSTFVYTIHKLRCYMYM